jgi:hypothetical protein
VRVIGELPVGDVAGVTEMLLGNASGEVGVVNVNGLEGDVPTEFVTVTETAPGNAASVAGMEAVSWVALTKVVACPVPFQFTTASLVKFVPVTARVKPEALQEGQNDMGGTEGADANSEVIAGGVPSAGPIVKWTTLDISVVVVLLTFVPDVAEPGICTATFIVPAVARSEAGTGAVS